jgi:hypothetical protein
MSKLDIGVGNEFPLDEGSDDRRQVWTGGHHGRHHHHMHRGHHHGPHGLGRLAILLVIAGLVALIVEHKLPAEAAYGLIGLGLAMIAMMFALRWRHHRRMTRQVS